MSSSLVGAHRRCFPLFTVWFALWVVASARTETPAQRPDAFARLAQAGHVLLMRHAYAPGVGDPKGMVLGDCSTQRNLDERGRAQARKLGERLRAAGVSDVRVYTSQWCRCRETAGLLAVGTVEDLPALNSFFEQPETRDERLAALRTFLDRLPRDGRPVVLVTHQVTVTALTGYFPSSGEGLVLKLREGGGFERVAELSASE
jgi:broad specificity phosphatase PhoE